MDFYSISKTSATFVKGNHAKSKVRCHIEHLFCFIEQIMGGLVFRGVGLVREATKVALTNLVYNMCRFTQIVRYHAERIKPESAICKGLVCSEGLINVKMEGVMSD